MNSLRLKFSFLGYDSLLKERETYQAILVIRGELYR